jgi:thiol-disulfide isomerase/thioredoxin
MKHRPLFILLAVFALAFSALAADSTYTRANWDKALKNLAPDADLIALFHDWADKADDIELLRKIQGDWFGLDSAGCVDFFAAKLKAQPESAKFTYLTGRFASVHDKLTLGRQAIALDLQWPYGYRLLAVTYQPLLEHSSAENQSLLESELPRDAAVFARWTAIDPKDEMAAGLLFSYYLYQHQLDSARAWFEAAQTQQRHWADPEAEAALKAVQQDWDGVRAIVEKIADGMIASKQIEPSERDKVIFNQTQSAYVRAAAYPQLLELLSQDNNPSSPGGAAYNLACYAVRLGHAQNAYTLLGTAIETGVVGTDDLLMDPEFESLHGDARWTALLERAAAAEASRTAKLAGELKSKRINKPAPDWTLTDAAGKSVHLSDLKGQVVLLDFWATWCGPCRMAMPILDRYMKTALPPSGVQVFSIDVWEQPPQKAKFFMRNKAYAMHLLLGNDDIVKAYGITGIPYLCAIDKQGNIAYEEHGYSPSLKNLLPLWVNDLLAQP